MHGKKRYHHNVCGRAGGVVCGCDGNMVLVLIFAVAIGLVAVAVMLAV